MTNGIHLIGRQNAEMNEMMRCYDEWDDEMIRS